MKPFRPQERFYDAGQKACLAVASAIVERIQRSTQTPHLTGELRFGYRAVREKGTGGAAIITDTRYWQFVEFGTRHMPAEPHMRPAIEYVRITGAL